MIDRTSAARTLTLWAGEVYVVDHVCEVRGLENDTRPTLEI